MSLESDYFLRKDINDIVEPYEHKYTPITNVSVVFHTEFGDLTYQDNIALRAINIHRNYLHHISDYIEIEVLVPQGTFIFDIYPYLTNLEATLSIEKTIKSKTEPNFYTDRYKVVFLLDKNNIPTNVNLAKENLNNLPPFNITLQLLNRTAETLRIKTVSGNFDSIINNNKSMKIDTFLRSVISSQSNKILIDNKPSLDAIEIESPDNTEDLRSLNLGSSTYVINIPSYLQNNVQGVYSSGLGSYIQTYKNKTTFFIYSLFNGKKYDTSENKIMIYIPSTNVFAANDVTYKLKNNILRLVTTSNPILQDRKDAQILSYGTGIRLSNANSFMKKPVQVTENGPRFRRELLTTEIVFENRKDNLNFAVKPKNPVSNNVFKELSTIQQNKLKYIELQWLNSDPFQIYPGAACKLIYENNRNEVEEKYGVIHYMFIEYVNTAVNPILTFNTRYNAMNVNTTFRIAVST